MADDAIGQDPQRDIFKQPATSLTDVLSALQNGVVAINNLNSTLTRIFPQATAFSTTAAVAGTITFVSSQATGFLSVVTSSGATVKVAVYS
jgi:hypothetical protein